MMRQKTGPCTLWQRDLKCRLMKIKVCESIIISVTVEIMLLNNIVRQIYRRI
jgi:hypothetical protein